MSGEGKSNRGDCLGQRRSKPKPKEIGPKEKADIIRKNSKRERCKKIELLRKEKANRNNQN